jgi:cytoskeletal protein CcmA (bactofilin family)
MSGGSVSNSGHFGAMTVTGGTFTNNIFGDVAGTTTNNGGTVNNSGSLAAVTNTSGTFNSNGGFIAGAINNSGAFFVTSTSVANSTFNNASGGALTVSAGFSVDQLLTNSATILVTTGGTLSDGGGLANNAGTFTNNGTVSTIGATVNVFTNAVGATFNTTGTFEGKLANFGTLNAAGAIQGDVNHQSGSFRVTGALTVNGTLTTGATCDLYVSGGNLTVATLVNNSNAIVHAVWIDAGRTLSATDVTNNGQIDVGGALNVANTIQTSGNLIVESTGTINASLNSTAGSIQVYGAINGDLSASGPITVTASGGSVSGRVTLATSDTFRRSSPHLICRPTPSRPSWGATCLRSPTMRRALPTPAPSSACARTRPLPSPTAS